MCKFQSFLCEQRALCLRSDRINSAVLGENRLWAIAPCQISIYKKLSLKNKTWESFHFNFPENVKRNLIWSVCKYQGKIFIILGPSLSNETLDFASGTRRYKGLGETHRAKRYMKSLNVFFFRFILKVFVGHLQNLKNIFHSTFNFPEKGETSIRSVNVRWYF